MRNEVDDTNENISNPMVACRTRRRKQVFIGVAGLAVLGAGSFLVTFQVADNVETETGKAVALVPVAPVDETPSESSSLASPSASVVPSSSASAQSPTATPTPTRSKTVQERIKSARAAPGVPVQRPLVPSKAVANAGPVTVKTIGSLVEDGATMRVISAKYDLTGQREMLWAADDGVTVGDAHCTQNFHFSNNKVGRERPTMLLCWKTSAKKSVVTVAVTKEGRPAKPASVAVIDKLWRTF